MSSIIVSLMRDRLLVLDLNVLQEIRATVEVQSFLLLHHLGWCMEWSTYPDPIFLTDP